MRKRDVISVSLFLIILVGLISFVVNVQAQDSKSIPEVCKGLENDEKEACIASYEFGKEFDKDNLKKAEVKTMQNAIRQNAPAFFKGLSDSGQFKDVDELREFLADFWYKKSNGDYIFNDELRNLIWKDVFGVDGESVDDREVFLELLLEKKIKEVRNKNDYSERENAIKEVDVENPGDFEWKDGKLVRKETGEGDNKKHKLWIDFEDLNPWLEKVVYKDGRLVLGFNTGVGVRDVDISGGTIGSVGEIRDPDGNIIGSNFNGGVKSINYDNGVFKVTYEIGGENQNIDFDENTLNPDLVVALKNLLNTKMDEEGKAKAENILNNIDNFGVDFKGKKGDYHSAMNSQLNVLWISDKYEQNSNFRERITIDYDKNGLPNMGLKNGAHIVSLDYNGEVDAVYSQVASKGKLGYSDYSNSELGQSDEEDSAKLVFDKGGSLIAGRNLKGILYQEREYKGSFRTSLKEMVKVNVVRNSFLDRGFIDSIIESGVENNERLGILLGSILDDEKVFERAIAGEEIDQVKLISGILAEKLKDPYLGAELKKQIERAKVILDEQMRISGENILKGIVSGDDESSRVLRERIRQDLANDAESALAIALQKSNLRALLGDDSEEFDNAFKNILRGSVEGRFAGSVLGGSQQIIENVIDNLALKDPDLDLRESILKAIEKAEIYNSIYSQKENKDFLRNTLESQLGNVLNEEDIDNLDSALKGTINHFAGIVDKERQRYLGIVEDRQKVSDMFFDYLDDYGGKTVLNVDVSLGSVEYKGDAYARYDSADVLREVRVDHSGSEGRDNFVLANNGKDIAYFNGDKIHTFRISRSNDYTPIYNIVNENNPNQVLRLDNVGREGFNLYDENKLVYQRNGEYAVGVPLLGSFALISKSGKVPYQAWLEIRGLQGEKFDPEKGLDFDIAKIDDVEINMHNVVDSSLQRRFLQPLRNIVRRIARGKVYEKEPELPTGNIAGELRKGFKEKITEAKRGMSDSEFQSYLTEQSKLLSDLERLNVNVPLKVKDQIYVAQNQNEFRKAISFFENAGGASLVSFRGNSISIDGRPLTGINPAIYRTILRSIYEQGMVDRYHSQSGGYREVRPDGTVTYKN